MPHPAERQRVAQGLGYMILPDDLIKGHGAPLAIEDLCHYQAPEPLPTVDPSVALSS
ncbi:unnamed protein product, partial [marine sediment metagenome]